MKSFAAVFLGAPVHRVIVTFGYASKDFRMYSSVRGDNVKLLFQAAGRRIRVLLQHPKISRSRAITIISSIA